MFFLRFGLIISVITGHVHVSLLTYHTQCIKSPIFVQKLNFDEILQII